MEEHLKRLLDPVEAGLVHLKMNTYHETVRKIVENTDGDSRINVVVMEKTTGRPVGLATFLKQSFKKLDKVTTLGLPLPDIKEELGESSRKVFYELQYCLRRSDMKRKCIGDVLLACGLEALGNVTNKRPAVVSAWLELAGSFTNLNALNLYTKFKFCAVGLYDNTFPIMSLSDVKRHVDRAKDILQNTLEASFLLPLLKEKCVPGTQTASNGNGGSMADEQPMEDSAPQPENESSQSTDDSEADASQSARSSQKTSQHDSQSARSSQQTSQHAARPAQVQQQAQPVVLEDQAQLEEQLRALTFRKYVDQLKWFSNHIVTSLSDVSPQNMLGNMSSMARRTLDIDKSFSFFQHLEMAKQIEAYASAVDKDPNSVLEDIRTQLQDAGQTGYSHRYLKKVVQVSWCIYRYAFLEQAILTWTDGKSMLYIE